MRAIFRRTLSVLAVIASAWSAFFWHLSANQQISANHAATHRAIDLLTTLSSNFNLLAANSSCIAALLFATTIWLE